MFYYNFTTMVLILAKIWKTTFPKELIFQWNLAQSSKNQQIYITEITFKKKIVTFQNGG